MNNRKLLSMFIITLVVIVVAAGGYWTWMTVTKLPVVSAAPDFTLENLDGEPVSFDELKGKIRVVEFYFANCPDICPMTTAKLVTVQNELKQKEVFGNEVVFIAITFDPENDTPEVVKEYMEKHGIDPNGWVMLRGSEEATKEVAKNFGVGIQKVSEGNFLHTYREALILVDEDGNIRKKYDMGMDMPSEDIKKDIQSVLRKG